MFLTLSHLFSSDLLNINDIASQKKKRNGRQEWEKHDVLT